MVVWSREKVWQASPAFKLSLKKALQPLKLNMTLLSRCVAHWLGWAGGQISAKLGIHFAEDCLQ